MPPIDPTCHPLNFFFFFLFFSLPYLQPQPDGGGGACRAARRAPAAGCARPPPPASRRPAPRWRPPRGRRSARSARYWRDLRPCRPMLAGLEPPPRWRDHPPPPPPPRLLGPPAPSAAHGKGARRSPMVAAARAGVMGPGAEGGERCGGGAEEDERCPTVPWARRRSASPRPPSRDRELRPAESRLLARWGRSARRRQQLACSARCSPPPWPLRSPAVAPLLVAPGSCRR